MTTISKVLFKEIVFLSLVIGQFSAVPVFAQQKSRLQTEVSAHGSFFLVFGDAGWGYGGGAKLLLPMENNENYITVGVIADRLRENRWRSSVPEPVKLIHAVGGYRKMLNKFFVEPQLGIGVIIETNKADVYWESDKTYFMLSLFPGIESGIHLGKMTFSVNYRMDFRDPFKDAIYSIFSLKAGFRFGGRAR